MVHVSYENKENVLLVQLNGELMIEDVEQLKQDFNEYLNSHKYFLFDFKNVSMIDSSGLGYIVYCLKKAREMEGDIKIENLEDQAKLIFEITRVNSILDIYDNETDAINSFKSLENSYESDNSNSAQIIA
jgi:anti-sigma B factor antagonist